MIAALAFAQLMLFLMVVGLGVSVLRIERLLKQKNQHNDPRAAAGPGIGSDVSQLCAMLLPPSQVKRECRLTFVWFMASGCRPCVAIKGMINHFANRYNEGVATVVVCGGTDVSVARYREGLTSELILVADIDRRHAVAWEINLSPFLVLVDKYGIVRRKFARMESDRIRHEVDSVLRESSMAVRPRETV